MTTQDTTTPRKNLGAIALSIMGWAELVFSIGFFAIGLPIVAIAFGLSALLLGFLSDQIARQRAEQLRRSGHDLPVVDHTERTPASLTVLGVAILMVPVAAYFAITADYMTMVVLVVWAMVLHMLSVRLKRPVDA